MVSHDAVIVICEEFETNGFGFGEVMTGVIGPHLHEDTDWSVYHRDYNILQVRFLHAADIKFLSKDPINLEVVVTN